MIISNSIIHQSTNLMSLDYPLSSLSTYALLILNCMALLCSQLWSTQLPRLLHSLLSSIPIFHILMIELPQNRIQQIHYFNISYPISQLIFLLALTLSMIFRNKIQFYGLIFITLLYASIANIYTVDFMITYQGHSPLIHKLCMVFYTVSVNIGLLLLIRPVKTKNVFNVSAHRQQHQQSKIMYTITAVSVSLIIIVYSVYFYKSHVSLIRIASNQNNIFSTPYSHIRHNNHEQMSNSSEHLRYFYNIYWIICPIVSGAILGMKYFRIFEAFDGKQWESSNGQYKKIEDEVDIQYGNIYVQNGNMNDSQDGDHACPQLNFQREKEKEKRKHYWMLGCAFLVVGCRWTVQFVHF